MGFFSGAELIDLVIMVFAVGFIFSKIFRRPTAPIGKNYDPLKQYYKNNTIEDLKWGIIVAAPAIVLHEFAHKFVAIAFGAQTQLQAPIMWYAIVILMIMLRSPFVFFVGGFVEIRGILTPLESATISFVGPLTNLILWGGFYLAMKSKSKFVKKNIETFAMMKKINMFLFIFNMIPIPGFDGYGVVSNLFRIFF